MLDLSQYRDREMLKQFLKDHTADMDDTEFWDYLVDREDQIVKRAIIIERERCLKIIRDATSTGLKTA